MSWFTEVITASAPTTDSHPCMCMVTDGGEWFIRRGGEVIHIGTRAYIARVWKQWEKSGFRCRDLRK